MASKAVGRICTVCHKIIQSGGMIRTTKAYHKTCFNLGRVSRPRHSHKLTHSDLRHM